MQGSRRTPYQVTITVDPLSDKQWERVLDALADQAIFTVQLLAGEMPPDIEEVFTLFIHFSQNIVAGPIEYPV